MIRNFVAKIRSRLVIILLVANAAIILSVLFSANVFAHSDGVMQLASAPAGPYKLTVWTWPDPPTPGELHVAIALVKAEDASPILDADVNVMLVSSSGDVEHSDAATTEDSENKFLYEVVMDVPSSDTYDITININDNHEAAVTFQLEVGPERGFNWLLLIPILIILGGVVYWIYSRRSQTSQ